MSKMKESGIPWIGKIPAEWGENKIKYVAEINPPLMTMYNENEAVGYIPMEAVKNGYVKPLKRKKSDLSTGLTGIQENDIIMAKVTPCFENGNIAIASGLSQNIAFGSSELFVFRAKEAFNRRYLFYYLQNAGFMNVCVSTMTGTGGLKRISSHFVKNAYITYPVITEQRAIADYLDDRCSKLDEIITEAEKSIEEYKELKQAVIANTVLYGVHKDVQLRNSGENWCKTIPSHWRFERGKYLFKETNIRSVDGTEELLTVSQYTGITPRSMKNVTMFEAASLVDYKICEVGDIAANTMWMWAGAVGVSEYYGVISPSYNTYRQTRGDFDSKYLDYLLRAVPLVSEYESLSTGIRASRLRLYPSQFLSIRYPVPPMDEQKEIVEYLNRKIGDMDALISEKQSLIEDLKAYKKSLIYEVVTGKRRVV